jgi:tol-pal system protein YbgF
MKTIVLARAFASAASAVLMLGAGGAGTGGCARTAEERQLDAMRADIDRIQDDRDRADQRSLGPGERDVPSAPSAPSPAAAAAAPTPAGPGDPVVHLGRSADEVAAADDYADPDDTAPRPRIRVLGSPRARGGEVESVDDGTPSGSSPSLDPEAKRSYDAAMAMVSAKQYDRALDALAAFLVKWPDHPYADHAMYWRGECYFARAEYPRAAEQFEGVVARFPAGAKAPDALLKLGMTRQHLGDAAGARSSFDRLAREYPQADAARRIPAAESHP